MNGNASVTRDLSPISGQDVPYPWIRKEVTLTNDIRRGQKGKTVRTIQEWLTLQGYQLGIDGDFGPATERIMREFQAASGLNETGVVDAVTFATLVAPMRRALTPIPADNMAYNELVVAYAERHLAEHPREVGGQNRGPWVRLYMTGHEGREWAWCAGFVCFLLRQAADTLERAMPFKRTVSCDILAANATAKGIFVSEKELQRGNPPKEQMPAGTIFLNRRTPTDWVHTGLVTDFHAETFDTIEGNTNDDGDREGYEVCRRVRGYGKKDFIRID